MIGSAVETIVRETMEKFQVPGIALLVARGTAAPESLFLGIDARGAPVNGSSLFPVASVSKLATALCILRLGDAGKLGLDDPLAGYLPDAASARAGVTIRTLLCHTAGLPMDLPNEAELYGTPAQWGDLARECVKIAPTIPPRTRVVYGNIGYGLLALVAERVTQARFEDVLRSQVLEPLGIEAYLGVEPPRPPMALADVRSAHTGTDVEPYNSPYYRALGLPWSGLVTTPKGALALVRAFAGTPLGYLSESLRSEATKNQTDDLPGGYGGRFDYLRAPWGLGVDLRGDKKPHWTPENACPHTFGHAGASGCVVWHDPDVDVSWVILGTRTADNAWLVRGATKIAQGILEK